MLGQVWYLIVSIPDFCNLTYFEKQFLVLFWSHHLRQDRIYCNIKISIKAMSIVVALQDDMASFDIMGLPSLCMYSVSVGSF